MTPLKPLQAILPSLGTAKEAKPDWLRPLPKQVYETYIADDRRVAKAMFRDPLPEIKRIQCPVLFLAGGKDTQVDVKRAAQIYRSAFKESGNRELRIRIFPNAGHAMHIANTGSISELRQLIADKEDRLVPEYFREIREFLERRISDK